MDFYPLGLKKSRLGCVREAISSEISRMKVEKEKIKVGLVTFGSSVRLIGDGSEFKAINLNEGCFNDFKEIVRNVSKINHFCQPINISFKKLKNVVEGLTTSGITALGPGLLSSI